MNSLPHYARIVRSLALGEHPFAALMPGIAKSPAAVAIQTPAHPLDTIVQKARVRIEPGEGYVWVDDEAPAIVLVENYYRNGNERDLYLDLLHELAHLRQIAEGRNVWNESLRYVDRPTEIEGYAIAIVEARRLGMSEREIQRHLSNPWMTREDVLRLLRNVERFLTGDGRDSISG